MNSATSFSIHEHTQKQGCSTLAQKDFRDTSFREIYDSTEDTRRERLLREEKKNQEELASSYSPFFSLQSILNDSVSETDQLLLSLEEEELLKSASSEELASSLALLSPAHLGLTPITDTSGVEASPLATELSSSLNVASLEQLYAHLDTVLNIVDHQGVKETSFLFQSKISTPSALSGMEIRIQEFSTAPRSYNIEFVASAEACKILQENMQVLFKNLEKSKRFKIHRCELSIGQQGGQEVGQEVGQEDGHSLPTWINPTASERFRESK